MPVGKVGSMKTAYDDRAPCLRSATLHNVHPFGPKVTFRFDPRVNLLIGSNGVGKSAALDRFAGEGRRRFSPASDESEEGAEAVIEPEGASPGDVTTVYVGHTRASLTPEMVLGDLQLLDVQGKVTAVLMCLKSVSLGMALLGFVCLIALVCAALFLDPASRWAEFGDENLVAIYAFLIVAYAVYLVMRLLVRSRALVLAFLPRNWLLSDVLANRSQVSPIFMFQTVLSANRRWLDPGRSPFSRRRSRAAHEAAELALSCAKEIAPEVFPAAASFGTGTIMLSSGTARSRWLSWLWRRSFTDRMSTVHTRYSPSPLHITSLSAGTQNTLLVAWYLALNLAYANEFREGWEDQPAILFIDEIENHLHPAWQRRFIPVFLEHFPNLQVIATTHSPFPIAGLKAGQVHKLYQDGGRITRVEINQFDIIGWTADEILHEYLDVQDPTDLETAQAVEVLRWLDGLEALVDEESAESWREAVVQEFSDLVGDDELTFEEALVRRWLTGVIDSPVAVALPLEGAAEAWRLSMIEKFRLLVGVDILSGGPAARQRQILEEQMATRFLRSPAFPSDDDRARG